MTYPKEQKYRTVSVTYVGHELRPFTTAVYKETHEGLMVSFDDAPFARTFVTPQMDVLINWLERGGAATHGYTWELR